MDARQARDLWFGILGFCGCGMPDDVLLLLGKALATSSPSDSGLTGFERVRELVKDNDEVAAFLIQYVLDRAGLSEHGSAVSSSWPTAAGVELVEYVTSLGKDEVVIDGEPDSTPVAPIWNGTHLIFNDGLHLKVMKQTVGGEVAAPDEVLNRIAARYATVHEEPKDPNTGG